MEEKITFEQEQMDAEPTAEELVELETGAEDFEEEVEEFYTDDSMKMYLTQIAQYELLTVEEEQKLGRIMAEGGPEAAAAREKLINCNLRLVVHVAKYFLGRGAELEDLNSYGLEGLIKAVDKFDYTRGYRFSTYATWWIRQAIARGVVGETSSIRIPVHMNETVQKIKKAKKFLEQQKAGREPSIREIAEVTGLSEEKVMDGIEAMYSIVSLEDRVKNDSDSTIGEFQEDENAVDPCEASMALSRDEAVARVLGELSPKEALVLKLRFGIGMEPPLTLEEIGALPGFGVTRERVRQLESSAIRKIKRNRQMMLLLSDYAV